MGHCYVSASEYKTKKEQKWIEKDTKRYQFSYRNKVYRDKIRKKVMKRSTYIGSVPETDQAIIAAHVKYMQSGDFESVRTKQLHGPIRELIVGHHRLTYFEFGASLYFVRGFRKKTTKAPKSEIDYAEKVYKIMKNSK